jgi:DNA-directed RNA polymerase alpha subunit
MKRDMDIQTFFNKYPSEITVRCVNAIIRSGIDTMDELCEKDEEQLRRIRNLGAKCLAHTLIMREKYTLELNNNH